MNNRLLSLVLAAASAASSAVAGPPPDARPLTVREAVRLALERAPEIAVAESEARASTAAIDEARSGSALSSS